jgi:hypothetical protein
MLLQQDCKLCILRTRKQVLPMCYLFPECHTASQYTHRCNFTCNHKKNTVFPKSVLTELTMLTSTARRILTQSENKCGSWSYKFIKAPT